MKVTGKVVQYHEVEISEEELISSLITRYGFDSDSNNQVFVEDGKLFLREIILRRGVSTYDEITIGKTTIISEDEIDIELFKCLTRAKELIKLREKNRLEGRKR